MKKQKKIEKLKKIMAEAAAAAVAEKVAEEIIEAVEVPAHLPELLVGSKVRRVGLLHLGGEAVCDVLALYYADLLQLL